MKNITLEIKHSLNGHNRLERTRSSQMGESKRSLRDSEGSVTSVKGTVTVEPRGEARGTVGQEKCLTNRLSRLKKLRESQTG